MGASIVKLAEKLGVDPATVRLARIYIPPFVRVRNGAKENVDGYWRTVKHLSDLTPEEATSVGVFERKKDSKVYSPEEGAAFKTARDLGAKVGGDVVSSHADMLKARAEFADFLSTQKKNKKLLKDYFDQGVYSKPGSPSWEDLPGDSSKKPAVKKIPEAVPEAPQPSEEDTPAVTVKSANWKSANSDWWETSDSPAAQDMKDYVAANGPYLYHGTTKSEYATSMLKQGVKSPEDLGWSEAEIQSGYDSDEPFMSEGVYLGSLERAQQFAGLKDGGMVRIDIRKLDPSKVGDVIDNSSGGVSEWDIEMEGSIPGSLLELVDPKTGEPKS